MDKVACWWTTATMRPATGCGSSCNVSRIGVTGRPENRTMLPPEELAEYLAEFGLQTAAGRGKIPIMDLDLDQRMDLN